MKTISMTIPELRHALRAVASPDAAAEFRRYFKTGPGDYAEGDQFLGVRVPAIRTLANKTDRIAPGELRKLVRSPIHEERLLGLLAWVRRFERGSVTARRRIFLMYLDETAFVNNWDLVDTSAPAIVGGWIREHGDDREHLLRLASSEDLWERRIAIIATLAFLRIGEPRPTEELAVILLHDPHDLIHKATGWMLRELGKRFPDRLRAFLKKHAAVMPRTMLRYAIEKFSPAERRKWLAKRASPPARTR